jgi:hypothetical protein
MANDFIFFILLLRPEWPLGKKTRGRGDLFRIIHLSLGAGASKHNEIVGLAAELILINRRRGHCLGDDGCKSVEPEDFAT